jgi:hypothetical protein
MISVPSSEPKGSIYFPIVFHLHQPIGNLPWVFEEAYEKSYAPLLQTIIKHPSIKINIHITGPLLIWMRKNHPEYLDQIKLLYSKKQVEIVGGGFYEPILAIIPEEDRIKQIQMTIDWWNFNYQIIPSGFWLAERVWVPDLPLVFSKLGIEYVFVDDFLFNLAGFSEEDTFYAYNTEYQGKTVVVFPINAPIRYLVPWKEPKKTVKYLQTGRDPNHEKIIVMISDAEKMGVWPAGDRTTHDICYVSGYDGKQGWMNSFFEALLSKEWIKPVLITEYLKNHYPRGLIYLPTSSYDKMSTWALPTPLRRRLERLHKIAEKEDSQLNQDILTFTSGSFWQNFLVKYSRSNIMHKRMLYCRNKIQTIEKKVNNNYKTELARIWKYVLASQSNDAFWHGMFGGVYYRFLRHECLKNILKAEYLLENICEKAKITLPMVTITDILLDGYSDSALENKQVSCFVSSLKGGSIFSLGLKSRGYDFSNILKRYKEAYHSKKAFAINDRIEKWSFQDHFFNTPEDIISYVKDEYVDLGNFANQPYDLMQKSSNSVVFERKGSIKIKEEYIQGIIVKQYSLTESKISVNYDIELKKEVKDFPLYFTPEMNFLGASFPYKTSGYINNTQFNLKETHQRDKCKYFEIQDLNEREKAKISVRLPYSVPIVTHPLMSLPKSEKGYEEQYQGTSFLLFFEMKEKRLTFKVEIDLEALD